MRREKPPPTEGLRALSTAHLRPPPQLFTCSKPVTLMAFMFEKLEVYQKSLDFAVFGPPASRRFGTHATSWVPVHRIACLLGSSTCTTKKQTLPGA